MIQVIKIACLVTYSTLIGLVVAEIESTGWHDVHVPLYTSEVVKQQPFTFSEYYNFISTLPELYGNIGLTLMSHIIQNKHEGFELAYDRSTFLPHICQNGYQINGYGVGLFVCSRVNTVMDDYFQLGKAACQRQLRRCSDARDRNDRISELHSFEYGSDMGHDPLQMSFSCVRGGLVYEVQMCTTNGIQGFEMSKLACASLHKSTACKDCVDDSKCLNHEYVCGILEIQQDDGQQAVGVICCGLHIENTVLISMGAAEKSKNSPSRAIEASVKQHFQQTSRHTYAHTYLAEEGAYGFYFAVCPPDYYVQGYNGQHILCSKEIHTTEINYFTNTRDECVQEICFPEEPKLRCILGASPKFIVCQNAFVATLGKPRTLSNLCDATDAYSNILQSRGLVCGAFSDENRVSESVCPVKAAVCGVVAKRFGVNWSLSGLICCYSEPAPEVFLDYSKDQKEEFLYFYNTMKVRKHALQVSKSRSYESAILNQGIQEQLRISEVLNTRLTPVYNRKLWVQSDLQDEFRYPETFIMCPKNSYVRGVQVNRRNGDDFTLLCSEEPPYIFGKEVEILGTQHKCLVQGADVDYMTCSSSIGAAYEICLKDEYFTPLGGGHGKKCNSIPCGRDGAVCGSTNYAYANYLVVICCEVHKIYPSRIPDATDEHGEVNEAAVKYVFNQLISEFRVANGRDGTQEEALAYQRNKHNLQRTLSIARGNNHISDALNQAIQDGESISNALIGIKQIANIEYWIIDDNFNTYQHDIKVLKAFVCSPNSYARGRVLDGVLCSQMVPFLGRAHITILGLEGTCLSTRLASGTITCLPPAASSPIFCARGFYGLNAPSSGDSICNNGNHCQRSRNTTNAKVCGLLMNPRSMEWEKIICCSQMPTGN